MVGVVIDDLAASGTLGSFTPLQLLAGECQLVTDNLPVTVGNTVVKYQVMAKTANKLVPWTTGQAYCIMAQPVDAYEAEVNGPVYVGGFFNHEALVWPGGVTTLAARKAAFDTHDTIKIGELYG